MNYKLLKMNYKLLKNRYLDEENSFILRLIDQISINNQNNIKNV